MKVFLFFILSMVVFDDINHVAAVNRLKKEAAQAYQDENYAKAATVYRSLIDSLGESDDRILLNLSNAYYKLNDTTNAKYHYNRLADSNDRELRSLAYQQLGMMASNQGKYDIALDQFRNSLRSDPANEDARYNYELLKKMMQEQQQNQQQQQDQQQDQNQEQDQQQNQQEQEQQDQQQNQQEQEQEQEEEQKQEQQEQQEQQQQEEEQKQSQNQPDPEKMEEMKISEEMARMILEAMKNNEVQYLQQQKKKPTKPRDSGKPDW